jgi:hypothetical protein
MAKTQIGSASLSAAEMSFFLLRDIITLVQYLTEWDCNPGP